MATVVFDSVTITYPGATRPSVDRLDLAIDDGEFLVLVGPSGCGKSTSLRALAGLEPVTSGQVSIGGKDVTGLEPAARDIAMVFQNYALYPHMNVRKNIGYPLRLAKMPKAEIAAKVEETARVLGLSELLDRKPKDLSGGQRQRVWLAMVLVQDTPVVLLDEPTTYLDITHQVEVLNLARDLQQQGVTVVAVLHELTLAFRYATNLVVMKQGTIVAEGQVTEVVTESLLKEVYELDCRLVDDPETGRPIVVPKA